MPEPALFLALAVCLRVLLRGQGEPATQAILLAAILTIADIMVRWLTQ